MPRSQQWTLGVAALAAILLAVAPEPSRAHMPEECSGTLSLTVQAAEGKARVAGWMLNEINTFRDIEEIISLMSTYMNTDKFFMEQSKELVECITQTSAPGPVDLDWLDEVISGLDESPSRQR